MRIFTFYSFKGGVGRSSLMFHLGDYWASKGYVVALLDMDLHAPGISLHPWLEKPRKKNEYHQLGISDLLATFYLTQKPEESTFQFFPPSRMLRQLKPPKGSNRWGSKGRMMVLPSGSVALPQYYPVKESQTVKIPSAEAGESEEPEQKALRHFARLLREDLESVRLEDHPSRSGIDFLLIDCRTGYLAMEELAMGYLAERVVLVSGLNHQNLEGLDLTLQKLRPQRVPPLYYSSELMVAFGPVPAHYMDDPQARQSLERAMGILEENRLAVKTGERAELLPPYFLLPYTPRLATSDEPVPQSYFLGRHHPYWEVVEQIADTLAPQKSVEDSKREILRQMLSITGTVLPPAIKTVAKESSLPTAKEKKGEELEEEFAISQNLRHPTRQNLAMMFQLPKWYWPFTDGLGLVQQRAWLKRYGFPAQLSDTQDKLLDGLCATISLSPNEKEGILLNWSNLSQFQIDSLITMFQEENKKFAARSVQEASRFMSMLFDSQREWAKLLRCDGQHWTLFLSRLEEMPGPFASWKHYAAYWFELTTLLEALGRYDAAEKAYRKSLELDSDNKLACYFLGDLLQDHLGRYEESEAAYLCVIKQDPKYVSPWNSLALLYTDHTRQCQKAMQCYRQGISVDPGNRYLLSNLGYLKLSLGEDWKAELQQALAGFKKLSDFQSLCDRIRLAVTLSAGEYLPSDEEMGIAFNRWDLRTNLHFAALLRALHRGDSVQPHLERVMALINAYNDQRGFIKALYQVAGTRPDLREDLRAAAAQLFNLPQEVLDRFRDQPAPQSLERYRPFVEGRSNGAGDARDLPLFCADAALKAG
ncbi:MAG: tetratricopeptide repeat protein [Magnetococcales bacterium]|nr:tetratricopeptide repeat protein [Magnetococcales bacterium]MBF0113455.1 tetratricopeptide repeat protein [Magnetococcales bacterium]